MSEKSIRAALESRLAAWAAARTPALRIAWENVPLSPAPTASETYLRAHVLPGETGSADLAGAHRGHVGVLQIGIVTPQAVGPGAAAGIVDELEALFVLNDRYTSGAVTVQVVSPVFAAPAIPGEADYHVPARVRYRADTI